MLDIHSFLGQYRDREVWYKPNPGNGGDALIACATYILLKRHQIEYRIIKGDEDLTGKTIFFGGGGNLVEYYSHGADFIQSVHRKARELVVLPHTFKGHDRLLSELGSNTTLIAREKPSFEHISRFNNIGQHLLMRDLVFELDVDSTFGKLTPAPKLIELVRLRSVARAVLKDGVSLSFFLKRRDATSTLFAFRTDVEKTNVEVPPDNIDVTAWINLDHDMTDEKKVEETTRRIFRFLNQFDVIHSNRLHVGIASSLLNKVTHFYDNSYRKNESVYEFSMKGRFENLIWEGSEKG